MATSASGVAAGVPSIGAAGVAGTTAGTAGGLITPDGQPSPKASPARRGSTYVAKGGRRSVKAYPVTESELSNLGLLQAGSTACFSLATFLIGIWLNVAQGIALQTGAPATEVAYWTALRIAFLIGGLLFAVVGLGLVVFGQHKIRQIKNETAHD